MATITANITISGGGRLLTWNYQRFLRADVAENTPLSKELQLANNVTFENLGNGQIKYNGYIFRAIDPPVITNEISVLSPIQNETETNYTPYIIGGVVVVAALIIFSKK